MFRVSNDLSQLEVFLKSVKQICSAERADCHNNVMQYHVDINSLPITSALKGKVEAIKNWIQENKSLAMNANNRGSPIDV